MACSNRSNVTIGVLIGYFWNNIRWWNKFGKYA